MRTSSNWIGHQITNLRIRVRIPTSAPFYGDAGKVEPTSLRTSYNYRLESYRLHQFLSGSVEGHAALRSSITRSIVYIKLCL